MLAPLLLPILIACFAVREERVCDATLHLIKRSLLWILLADRQRRDKAAGVGKKANDPRQRQREKSCTEGRRRRRGRSKFEMALSFLSAVSAGRGSRREEREKTESRLSKQDDSLEAITRPSRVHTRTRFSSSSTPSLPTKLSATGSPLSLFLSQHLLPPLCVSAVL